MLDISVIIPVYKTEKYLEKCVSSVLNGGVENIEILLIDDGSPDNSGKLCDKLAEGNSKIKVFHKANGGLSTARNLGIEKATGKYLCFVDSDDYLEENALAKMLEITERESADISIFGLIIDVEGSIKYNVFEGDYILTQENKNDYFKPLKNKCLIDSCCNKLYLASFIKETGVTMPEGEFFEDTYFNLVLWQKFSKCVVSNNCFYHYLQRSAGGMTKVFNANKLETLKSRAKLMSEVAVGIDDFCNFYYVKSILSFLCDAFLKNSGIKGKERKNLIIKEIKDDKFKEAANKAIGIGVNGKLLVAIAKSNSYILTNLFLRFSYFIKYRLNKLFFRVKRI